MSTREYPSHARRQPNGHRDAPSAAPPYGRAPGGAPRGVRVAPKQSGAHTRSGAQAQSGAQVRSGAHTRSGAQAQSGAHINERTLRRTLNGIPAEQQQYDPRYQEAFARQQAKAAAHAQASNAAIYNQPRQSTENFPRSRTGERFPTPAPQDYRQPVTTQTQPNWQPMLPVSPWSTRERDPVIGGAVETVTMLRWDLVRLERSRFRGWLLFGITAGMAVIAIYLELGARQQMTADLAQSKTELIGAQQSTREALSRLAEATKPVIARPAPVDPKRALATARSIEISNIELTKPIAPALLDELKQKLGNISQVHVEARGERVVVSIDNGLLFIGRESRVGVAGYRVLYRVGKALKAIRDRRIVVSVEATDNRRGRGWALGSARSAVLARFLTGDLNLETSRVSASRIPRTPSGAVARAEFVLEPLVESRRS